MTLTFDEYQKMKKYEVMVMIVLEPEGTFFCLHFFTYINYRPFFYDTERKLVAGFEWHLWNSIFIISLEISLFCYCFSSVGYLLLIRCKREVTGTKSRLELPRVRAFNPADVRTPPPSVSTPNHRADCSGLICDLL